MGAMMTSEWTKPNYALRHIVTQYAVHGFHHKVCAAKRFHEPSDGCVCMFCKNPCDHYHAAARRAGSDGSMSASGSAGLGFDLQRGNKF